MDISRLDDCICVTDFAELAEKRMPSNTMAYANTGAMEEQTLDENRSAFRKWRFQPRCMRDVSEISLKCTVLGQDLNLPIAVGPTGQLKMFSDAGEIDAARAAESLGTVFTKSMFSSVRIDDIAASTPNGLNWFQLYVLKDRDFTRRLVARAERNGVKALVVTVDCPIRGKRLRYMKYKPITINPVEFDDLEGDWKTIVDSVRDCCTSWEYVDWLRSITRLPIVIKGVLTAKSAMEAVEHGASAVWVSNHGGRQFDGVLPSIYALPGVVQAIEGRCPVFFDGGVRTGGNVAKAIVLGADCVFLGRPIVWGVGSGGQEGAKRVLEILMDELSSSMKLLGVTSVHELKSKRDLVVHESNIIASFS